MGSTVKFIGNRKNVKKDQRLKKNAVLKAQTGCSGHCSSFLTLGFTSALCVITLLVGPRAAQA